LVFVTKYRHGVLDTEMLNRSEYVMTGVCADFDETAVDFDGARVHTQLLVQYWPKVARSRVVNLLKGVSSRQSWQDFVGRINRARMVGRFWPP